MCWRSPTCIALLCLIHAVLLPGTSGINCYKCTSTNGSETACEDPINTSRVHLVDKCMVPKEGHVGFFPANYCIKIFGKDTQTDELLVVRDCTMKTMDSQCGTFKYQEQEMTGCILTCDYNGCNWASSILPNLILSAVVPLTVLHTH